MSRIFRDSDTGGRARKRFAPPAGGSVSGTGSANEIAVWTSSTVLAGRGSLSSLDLLTLTGPSRVISLNPVGSTALISVDGAVEIETTASNGNVILDPHGTGSVVIPGSAQITIDPTNARISSDDALNLQPASGSNLSLEIAGGGKLLIDHLTTDGVLQATSSNGTVTSSVVPLTFSKLFYLEDPAASDSWPLGFLPNDATIKRINYMCAPASSTVDFNIEERAETTPFTTGTEITTSGSGTGGDYQASNTMTNETSFDNATLDQYDWLQVVVSAVSSSPAPTTLQVALTVQLDVA